MSMQATWVVVADRNCATVFSVPRGLARLRQLAELHYSPMPVNGDAGEPCGGDIQASEQVPDCVERQARGFATQVALYVEKARLDLRFDELILVAGPTFLSYLRESLGQTVRDALVAEIPKNLVGVQRETLQEQVLRVL
jgi:protein required for attachment to host cells